MLEICKRISPRKAELTLTLPFEMRKKSRFRAELSNGEQAKVDLPRGQILRDGQYLEDSLGRAVHLFAADEDVSTAYASDTLALVRGAYHLGNRHVPVQIVGDRLRYKPDHVLDHMLEDLGFEVRREMCAFEPEGGAYAHVHNH